MLEEYFSYDLALIPEGRKAYALWRAVEVSSELTPAADIIAKARVFEEYLKEAEQKADGKPKLKAVKGE